MKYKAKVTATWFVDVNVKFEINTFSNESDKSSEQAIDNALNLIDELQKIEDKSRGVILSQGGMTVGGIRFHQSNIEFVSEARRTVWLSNANGTVEKYVEKYGDAL